MKFRGLILMGVVFLLAVGLVNSADPNLADVTSLLENKGDLKKHYDSLSIDAKITTLNKARDEGVINEALSDIYERPFKGFENEDGHFQVDSEGILAIDGNDVFDTENENIKSVTRGNFGDAYKDLIKTEMEDGTSIYHPEGSIVTESGIAGEYEVIGEDFSTKIKSEGDGAIVNANGEKTMLWAKEGSTVSATTTFGGNEEITVSTSSDGPMTNPDSEGNRKTYASLEMDSSGIPKVVGDVEHKNSNGDVSHHLIKDPKGVLFTLENQALTNTGALTTVGFDGVEGTEGFEGTEINIESIKAGKVYKLSEVAGKTIVGENFIVGQDSEGNKYIKVVGEGETRSGASSVHVARNGYEYSYSFDGKASSVVSGIGQGSQVFSSQNSVCDSAVCGNQRQVLTKGTKPTQSSQPVQSQGSTQSNVNVPATVKPGAAKALEKMLEQSKHINKPSGVW